MRYSELSSLVVASELGVFGVGEGEIAITN
jgi:hypothetical protein